MQTKINNTKKKILEKEEQCQEVAIKLKELKNKLEQTLIECDSVSFLIPKRKNETDLWCKKKRKVDLNELINYSSFVATTTSGPPLVPISISNPPHPQRVIPLSALYDPVEIFSGKNQSDFNQISPSDPKKQIEHSQGIDSLSTTPTFNTPSSAPRDENPSIMSITNDKIFESSKDGVNKESDVVNQEMEAYIDEQMDIFQFNNPENSESEDSDSEDSNEGDLSEDNWD